MERAADKQAVSLKEQAVLEVLAASLGLGRGARLAQMLPERSGLPTESGASYYTFPTAGMLAVQMRVEPGRIDRVEADYFRELDKFKRELLSEGELQRAKVLLENATSIRSRGWMTRRRCSPAIMLYWVTITRSIHLSNARAQ